MTNDDKNDMQVMVLTGLAGICKKLAENAAVPKSLSVQAREFVEEFDALSQYKGKGAEAAHAQGEILLASMARFLPRVLDVESEARFDAGEVP